MSEGTTYHALRGRHRTFLFWAVVILVISSVAVGVIGVQQEGWTAGAALRAIFIAVMIAVWVVIMRRGTTADPSGMTLRSGLGTRHLTWPQVGLIGTDQPGADARRATALVDGKALVLPGVQVAEVEVLETLRQRHQQH